MRTMGAAAAGRSPKAARLILIYTAAGITSIFRCRPARLLMSAPAAAAIQLATSQPPAVAPAHRARAQSRWGQTRSPQTPRTTPRRAAPAADPAPAACGGWGRWLGGLEVSGGQWRWHLKMAPVWQPAAGLQNPAGQNAQHKSHRMPCGSRKATRPTPLMSEMQE